MTVLDTSVLLAALTGPRPLLRELRRRCAAGERLAVPALVLFDWRLGPRTGEELASQEELFPAAAALPFEAEDAQLAATLFKRLSPGRASAMAIAIAACALRQEAALWTLHGEDFAGIPGLQLV
ncbi:MAG: type II toxin-antitoxin system VapC family toxin [Terriglobales bacterium]